MSLEPQGYPDRPGAEPSQAASRLTLPGVFLIGTGALNLIGGILLCVFGMVYASIPVDQVEREMHKNPRQREQLEQLRKEGWTVQDVMNLIVRGGLGGGAIAIVASLVTMAGGACMLARKARGLGILGSVLAAIPCISPTSCCLVGMGVGIWSLVVLLNPEVRAAFQGAPPSGPEPGEWPSPGAPTIR